MPRLVAALLISELLIVIPVSVTAGPPASHQELSVAIAVTTQDCNEVTVDYTISWRGIPGGVDENISSILLRVYPDSFPLTQVAPELGKKTDKKKGHLSGQVTRESGYFDSQTYPSSSYQVMVSTTDGSTNVLSDPVSIPVCVPMSVTSGPAAGGTAVTVFGGGTFGFPPFTAASTVSIGGAAGMSPTAVAPDGRSMTFLTPAGSPNTCTSVSTDPGLPFPLPEFCYGD